MSHLNTKLARYKSFFPFQDGVSWDSSATCIRGEIGIGDSDSYAGVDIQIGAFIIHAHGFFLLFFDQPLTSSYIFAMLLSNQSPKNIFKGFFG